MKTAEKRTSEKRMVEIWEEKMRKANNEFAMIRTTKAVYDRVAIIADLPTMLTIQFPISSSKNKGSKSGRTPSGSFTIKQENISKRDIIQVRYYRD